MSRTKPDLASIVREVVKLNETIKDAQEAQKALADRAYVSGLVKAGSEANARKVVKQLAKEMEWEGEQRASQAQLEMALDQGRVDLGIAVEAQTDLEDAVRDMAKSIDAGEVDIKVGDDPWMSEQRKAKRAERAH